VKQQNPKIQTISIAKFLGQAIDCIHEDRSIGRIFKKRTGLGKGDSAFV